MTISYVHKITELGWHESSISDTPIGQSLCGQWYWKDSGMALSQSDVSELIQTGFGLDDELTEGEVYCPLCFPTYIKSRRKD